MSGNRSLSGHLLKSLSSEKIYTHTLTQTHTHKKKKEENHKDQQHNVTELEKKSNLIRLANLGIRVYKLHG